MESEINVIGRGRIKKIQARMDDKKVNWIYIGEGPNMAFATGHVAKPPAARLDKVRLRTVLIPVEGEPIFLCPALLAPGVKETSWVEDVRTPAGGEHFDAIADIFGAKNGHSLRVGIDEKLMWGVVQRLESILEKDSELVEVTEIFHDLRLVKDEDEIELLRRASEIADLALTHAIGQIEPGKSEIDIANELVLKVRQEGGNCTLTQVVSGAGRYPETPSKKKIEKGDVVTLDLNVEYQGYFSDETRVAVVGKADSEQAKVHRIVLEANKAAREIVQPGAKAEDVHFAGADVIKEHGYEKFFTHGIGHGLGAEGHEAPYLSARSDYILKSGMVHTIEPAIYGRTVGKFTIRLEDVVLVTERGSELLTTSSHDLIEV